MARTKTVEFKMRIRVYVGERMLGPGKMELLAQIDAAGSLVAAAKAMEMSYMRAWKLVQELNHDSERPMVTLTRGGSNGGAATVTSIGKKVLELYRRMDQAAAKAAGADGAKLARLLQ